MICPDCSHENKGDDLFCGKCGRKLERKHSLVIDISAAAREDSAFTAASDFTYRPEVERPAPSGEIKTPGFSVAADLTYRPLRKDREKQVEAEPAPAASADAPLYAGEMEFRPEDPTVKEPKAALSPDTPWVIPVFSGKKARADAEKPAIGPDNPPIARQAVDVPERKIYKPEMPGKQGVSWRKITSLVLALTLVAGLVFGLTRWNDFGGTSGNSSDKRSNRDDDDDDDRDRPQGGLNSGDYENDGGFGEDAFGPGYPDSDTGYQDSGDALGYIDCSGCVGGRCSVCMGDDDYAGSDCQNCDDGVCKLCGGEGIIFY